MEQEEFEAARLRFLTDRDMKGKYAIKYAAQRGVTPEEYVMDEDYQEDLRYEMWDSRVGTEAELMFEDGTVKKVPVVQVTGGMDEGSFASVTYEIDGRYFQRTGYYASHEGYDWEDGDWYEVIPGEKTIKVWNRK